MSNKLKKQKSGLKEKVEKNDSDDVFTATLVTDSGNKLLVHLDELVSGLYETHDWLFRFKRSDKDGYSKVDRAVCAMNRLLKDKSTVSKVLLVPYTELFAQSDKYDDVAKINEDKFEDVWKVIESLSVLVIHPHIMATMVEYGKFKVKGTKEKLKNNLLFTFALRNILSKVAFHSVVSKTVFDALRGTVNSKKSNDAEYSWTKEDAELPWTQMVAFVGFNRLMSPNNKAGVSISSDIDFNLVLDPNLVRFKGKDSKMKNLNEIVNKAMKKKLGDKFDKARLTLEVESFTTDDLDHIKTLMETNEASRNFYASMKNNHILVAGSKKATYKKFRKLLDEVTSEKSFRVAKRTHNQYLADSAKGSILAIKHLDKLTIVLEACKKFMKFGKLDIATRTYFKEKVAGFPKDGSNKEQNEWLVGSMGFYAVVLKKDVRDDNLVKLLAGKDEVKEALGDVSKLFPSIAKDDYVELLKRVAKILKGIAAGSYSPRSGPLDFQQIGSSLAKDTAWRFNIKYCGCRLSDFIDAVPLEEFKEWDTSDTSEATYKSARELAVVINKLSLTLQTAIYLAATHRLQPVKGKKKAKAAKHATIDTLYATITKESFVEIVVLNAGMLSETNSSGVNIRDAILELVTFLKGDSSTRYTGLRVVGSGTNVVACIDALASKDKDIKTDPSKDGFQFFQAIFDLAFATSKSLVPIKKKKKRTTKKK
mmetsp:Transcript_19142/g.31742  ORF Transcript_19142/g.31742 Transcript_19142/m.31742 type:complete len:706 (-) Transcript_19142:158-2275(-)